LDLPTNINLGYQLKANKYFTPEYREGLHRDDVLLLLNISNPKPT